MHQTTAPVEIKSLIEVPADNFDLILADLDNTFYDYHSCHKIALDTIIAEVQKLFGIDAERATELYMQGRQKTSQRHKGMASSHSRLFYIQDMLEQATGRTQPQLTMHLYNMYWDTFINQMHLFDGAMQFLKRCSTANVPVVIVTDMTAEVQFKKINHLGISNFFNFIVTSEEAGVEKPHPYIFELAIGKILPLKPAIKKIAVVGDDVKKDVHISDIYDIAIYHLR